MPEDKSSESIIGGDVKPQKEKQKYPIAELDQEIDEALTNVEAFNKAAAQAWLRGQEDVYFEIPGAGRFRITIREVRGSMDDQVRALPWKAQKNISNDRSGYVTGTIQTKTVLHWPDTANEKPHILTLTNWLAPTKGEVVPALSIKRGIQFNDRDKGYLSGGAEHYARSLVNTFRAAAATK